MTTQAQAPAPAAAPAASPAPPQPGTPEYNAAMVAAFENQKTGPVVEDLKAAVENAGKPAYEPKPDEKKADEPKPDEPKPDEPKPDEKKADEPKPDIAKMFDDGVFAEELARDGKLSDATLEGLKAAGIPQKLIDRFVELEVKALQSEAAALTAKLHEAAGGKEKFEALVAWGKANLSPQEREFFDAQLNGPFAAEALKLIEARRGADPSLHVGGGGGGAPTGFRSQAEMTAAMSDPRYQADPAYRAEVARKLALSAF